ncbi:MAG: iron-containing alcohol dehydrogenase [Alphaproteobacteria bacterium]|nr:iron-containing alcohol dehydrogenase [Alphaproteobacteria bacterium]
MTAGIPGIPAFSVSRLPRIVFGPGRRAAIAMEARHFGTRALIVTGARSFRESADWASLQDDLTAHGVAFESLTVEGEPSPELVDQTVGARHKDGIEMVIGIGGGSALDAAKAIAGLLPQGNSVMDYLEGVGLGRPFEGPALPFIAVPTTAGTGSEATKNAVLSRQGPEGFKKSFRHESLVARLAIVDPDFLASCPRSVIAANGMDAFTQLLEGYVATGANPVTDALAWSGMEAFHRGFLPAWRGEAPDAAPGRACMAYAALISGIVLAQTGLGSVHGLASPLGAFYPIPHGAVCGTLVAEATDINIRALESRAPDSPVLDKYARVGALLAGRPPGDPAADPAADRAALVDVLRDLVERVEMPRLGSFGLTEDQVGHVVAASRGGSMKTNPLVLEDAEIDALVRRRL